MSLAYLDLHLFALKSNFFSFGEDPRTPKAGRWYKKIGARVNLDQNDPENNDGEVRFWIGVAKNCARAFK